MTAIAPPKSTGGGGFVFEDQVCAWWLACMLAAEPPFGAVLGLIERVDFQTRVEGWLLDDALLTTTVGPTRHRFGLSIKSNAQFGAMSAPADFVLAAWQQWLHVDSTVFDRTADFLGLVTAPITDAMRNALNGLLPKVQAADPATFKARINTPRWTNQAERDLFSSFDCPKRLVREHPEARRQTAALLQRLRFRQFDFGETTQSSLTAALATCRSAVRNDTGRVEDLWNALCSIAAELRPSAGAITRVGLIERLRARFTLADHPDHRADWETLEKATRAGMELVPNTIAGKVQVPRGGAVNAVRNALAMHDAVTITGRSGVGKSSIARCVLEQQRDSGDHVLWVDASAFESSDFNAFQLGLRVRHTLSELMGAATSRNPLLIIDGLDRVFSDSAFRITAALIRAARQPPPATCWRIAVPTQSQAWPSLLDALRRAGINDIVWKLIEIEPLTATDLVPVLSAVPQLGRLLLRPPVAALMGNLKILDLVAGRIGAGIEIDAGRWVGETNVAAWFWDAEVDRGPERVSRGRFARALAQRQGDEQLAAISSDSFDSAELRSVESLVADRICVQASGDRLAFAHDLYGDWARLRLLVNDQANIADVVRARQDSPLWHRAIRLYGLHLLEQVGDIDSWRAALHTLRGPDLQIAYDLLLEAPVFAVDPGPLLEAILPELVADDCALLRRLLTRFLSFGTLPDLERIALAVRYGIDDATARATFRYPHWPYWLPLLVFLHHRRQMLVPNAPYEIAAIVEMWLHVARRTLRREVSEIAVSLGCHNLATRGDYGDRAWHEQRQAIYRCVLGAAAQHPDEVATIILTACARRHVQQETGARATAGGRRSLAALASRPNRTEPWPDGPERRVDEDVQVVILEGLPIHGLSIIELLRVRPTEAREAILACLIEPPLRRGDTAFELAELNVAYGRRWHPALYSWGPFLACLQHSFEIGLDIVVRLVDFATERWQEYEHTEIYERHVRLYGAEAADAELARTGVGSAIEVTTEGGRRAYIGGANVFPWSATSAPKAVQAALMALEEFFYEELTAKRDIGAQVEMVLERTRSVAFLKVLIDVGKKEPALFTGPLRGFLAEPCLYQWDIWSCGEGRQHLMNGSARKGHAFAENARAFHGLAHRAIDMREIATHWIFNSGMMRDFFTALVGSWPTDDEEDPASMRAQLRLRLDPENWEDDPEQEGRKINRKLIRWYQARAEEHRPRMEQSALRTFPIRCRMLLDEARVPDDAELNVLWAEWTRIRALPPPTAEMSPADNEPDDSILAVRDYDEQANAIAGGIAVFVKHAEWLARDPAREPECRAALRALLADVPPFGTFSTPDIPMTWTWQCFLAEALSILWSYARTDIELRCQVAHAVFWSQYVAVEILFRRCAERRATLAEDFERLRRLVLEWAYARARSERLRILDRDDDILKADVRAALRTDITTWCEERVEAFAAATSSPIPAVWAEADERERFAALDIACAEWRHNGPDFHLLRRAHAWGPLPDRARDDEERRQWIAFWCAALDVMLARPSNSSSDDAGLYPDEDEAWLLENAAIVVLQMRSDELPEQLWSRVIELPDHAHDWIDIFIHDVYIHVLAGESTLESAIATLRAIVGHALSRPHGWSMYERVWDSLIGVGDYVIEQWKPEHATIVEALVTLHDTWRTIVPSTGNRLGRYALWLGRPAARSLRLRTLPWFASLLDVSDEEYEVRDLEDACNPVAALLAILWSESEQGLRGATSAFAAFRALLRRLIVRRNSLAMELAQRMGSVV